MRACCIPFAVFRNAGDHFMVKDKMINYIGFRLYFVSHGERVRHRIST